MSDQYEETYYMVPSYIRKLPGMTLGYMDIYNIIFQFWNKGRQCFVRNEEFMKRTGFTEKYISNGLTYFENLGELERVMFGKKRYLVRPAKRIEVEVDGGQVVDNLPMVELQFRDGRTTVPPMVELQFQKTKNKTPPQATRTNGPRELSFLLNKESLNKELNNHDHDDVKHLGKDLSYDDNHMLERLLSMGVVEPLALKIVTENSISTINNIIEVGKLKGVRNMGAYINKSIKQLIKQRG